MIVELLFVLGILYGGGMLLFGWTLAARKPARRAGYRPTVSIIVAARNEESSISACLSSLSKLSYPPGLLEIVVVDDHSTDGTADIVTRHCSVNPALRLVEAGEPDAGRHGKVNALISGIQQTRGDILLFTDADCVVPPGWVESTVSYYADERVAIVAGFITISGTGWLAGIQGLDWLMLVSAASATASLGFPVTAVGNNLSVRRSAYEAVGGFEGIPFSVTEDFALVKAVTSGGTGTVVLPLDPETAVSTLPCESLTSLLSQRRRWFVGGHGMPVSRVLAFSIAWLLHVALIPALWLIPPVPWLLLVAAMMVADLFLVLPSLQALKQRGLLKYWLHFQPYFWFYLVALPVVTLLKPGVFWKERKY